MIKRSVHSVLSTLLLFFSAGMALSQSQPAITNPVPGSILTSATTTFQWTSGTGVVNYYLSVGTSLGAYDIYGQYLDLNLSATVSGLPTDASTLYVRLYWATTAGWHSRDYTYTASGAATTPAITNPPPGSTFASSTVTFQWTSGTGVTNYFLYVGRSLGTNDLYAQSQGLNLSATVSGLPVDGSTLYVRLWWATAAAGWQYADYTYTAKPLQVLANNVPASGLSGAQWSLQLFKFAVPAGQGRLSFTTSGGTGDCDIYVRFGTPPTTSSYGYSSAWGGNAESVTITSPTAGDWYVLLYGYSGYTGLTLTGSYGTADLTGFGDSISQTAIVSGESLAVTLSVTNQGSAQSEATQIHFYFRTNANSYNSAAYVGQIGLPALNPGATANSLQFSHSLPLNQVPGAYALSYWIDAPGYVTETDESNNLRTWTGITVNSAPVQLLANNVPVSNLSGTQGSMRLFKLTVPAGQGRLNFTTGGGTGDCDVYVRFGTPPTTSSYGYSSAWGGNAESVTITSPTAGDWYVMLYGYSAYSGLTLTGSYGTADLTGFGDSISQTAVAAGDSLTVTLSVTNQGGAASDATQVYFYFRTNANDYGSAA